MYSRSEGVTRRGLALGRQNRVVGVKLGLEVSSKGGGSLLWKSTGSGKACVSSEGSAAGTVGRLVEIRGGGLLFS